MNPFIKWYAKKPLIGLIAGGLVIGIVLAIAVPKAIPLLAIFGKLFVGALKGIAPILVFVLVRNAMARDTSPENASMRPVIGLYMIGTFCAALVAVAASFLFPTELKLSVANANLTPPSVIIEVLKNLLLSVVDNPVNAIIKANYISILAWAILFGIALRKTSPATQSFIADVAEGVTKIVQWIIRFAPFGIMGLVADAIGESGLDALLGYARLLAVLLGAFFSVALIMNPLRFSSFCMTSLGIFS